MTTDQVLNEFLRQYYADVEAGGPRPLREYQQRFPGHDALIAGEYQQLCSDVPEPMPAAGDSGQQVGRYRLLRLLGRGGQGLVWLAEDTALQRRVALKLLTELAAISPDALVRFQREALIASRLDDPGICPVYETGTADGVPFIAMRYVDGETLAARIAAAQRQPAAQPSLELPGSHDSEPQSRGVLKRLMLFAERAARSLHTAHEAGIVHRDIKPGNIMVAADGTPVLLDFGLARVQDDSLPTLTRTGDFFGTPAYMAPEQLEAGVVLDRRADVYSLGATLYEALTLHRPFELPTRERLYQAIRSEEPSDPRRFHASLPDDLALVLATAMEKDRGRRYQTALDLAEDLRRWRTGEPIMARAPSRAYRLRKFIGRHRALAIGAAAVFLVLSFGVVGTGIGLVQARAATVEAKEHAGKAELASTAANAAAVKAQAAATAEATQRRKADSTRIFLEWAMAAATPNQQGRDVSMVQVLDAASERLAGQPGDLDADVLASLQRIIGQAYQQRGEFEKAETALKAALAGYEQLLGEGDQRTAETMAALFFLYHERGRLPEAEALAQRTMAIVRREKLADSAPDVVLALLNNYCILLKSLQRAGEALPLAQEAVAIAEQLPEESPTRLSTLNNAARLYDVLGRSAEAEPVLRKVLEVRRRTLGDQDPKTLISIDGLAFVLHKLRRCDEAQVLFAESLAGFRRRHGDRALETLRCMCMMGTCLRDSGRQQEAEPVLRGSVEGFVATQGEAHVETVNARLLLATLLLQTKRPEAAEQECRRALEASAGQLPPGQLRLLVYGALVQGLRERQQFAEAETELQAALVEARQVKGGGAREVGWVEGKLAELYQAWGRPEEAAAHRRAAGSDR